MIVQAISLLDDLDKELNNYVMRAREWYGWHFPELGKIVTDNLAFAKTIKMMGKRSHVVNCCQTKHCAKHVQLVMDMLIAVLGRGLRTSQRFQG